MSVLLGGVSHQFTSSFLKNCMISLQESDNLSKESGSDEVRAASLDLGLMQGLVEIIQWLASTCFENLGDNEETQTVKRYFKA